MLPIRKQRLWFIIILICSVATALFLVLYALQQNINFFYTPSQISQGDAPIEHIIRVGGLVKKGSVHHLGQSLQVSFELTDNKKSILIKYDGILPTLFREGQGTVVEGMINSQGTFIAQQVLAKHDANYTPREVANSLK